MAEHDDLGAHVRDTLITRYGSMAAAAERLDFDYDRLRKAVQRNRFSAHDIEMLFPGTSVEELKGKFEFNFSRRGSLSVASHESRFDVYQTIETGFRSFQRGVREIDFSNFVRDLYEKLGVSEAAQAMTLFCDRTSQPLEWNGDQVGLMQKLGFALDQGAVIIYVMEADLSGSIRSRDIPPEDIIDLDFDRYLGRLDRFREESDKGFIALVRVRKCPFCIPYQKPALFSCVTADDSEPNHHHALTTVDVPERSAGVGFLGTAVLPQREEVANAMRDFLIDLVLEYKKGSLAKTDFRAVASHKRGGRADQDYVIDIIDQMSNY